jgi:chromosomal replication initiation ATPase DnaA
MIKIGFSGNQGSGKTYLANKIKTNYSMQFNTIEIIKLAELVYKISEYIYYILEQPFKKDRKLLQLIGTEIGRDIFDKDIWVKLLSNKIKTYDKTDVIIVDDIRFKNELKLLKKEGFLIYRVVPKKQKNIKKSSIFHKSEFNILKYYEIIDRIRCFFRLKPKYFDKIIYNIWE